MGAACATIGSEREAPVKHGYADHEPVHHPHRRLPQPHRAPTARGPGAGAARRRAPRAGRRRLQPFQRRAARWHGPLPAQPARCCGARCRRTTSCWSTRRAAAGRPARDRADGDVHPRRGPPHGGQGVRAAHPHAHATALTLTERRALDTTLSQNAMRFHGRVGDRCALQRAGAGRVRRRAHRARDERRRRGVPRQPRRHRLRRAHGPRLRRSVLPRARLPWSRCWRSRPAGR